MQMKILHANKYVYKSPSFDWYFYVGDIKIQDYCLPQFHFLAPQSGHFIQTKQAWQSY